MRVSKQGGVNVNIVLNEEKSKQVTHVCYLGLLITDNGSCSKEIKANKRNRNGKNRFQQTERTAHQRY